MGLLFFQAVILTAVLLGAYARASDFPCGGKEGFVFQIVFLMGLLLAILEGIWCGRCPFFLEKLARFRTLMFMSFLRTSQICQRAFT
jgi:hypothetical protein